MREKREQSAPKLTQEDVNQLQVVVGHRLDHHAAQSALFHADLPRHPFLQVGKVLMTALMPRLVKVTVLGEYLRAGQQQKTHQLQPRHPGHSSRVVGRPPREFGRFKLGSESAA